MFLDLFIPPKYLEEYGHLLDGSRPYKVVVKRGETGEYRVGITVHPEVELEEKDNLMAIDINSGHLDWCVVKKVDKSLVESGRINCYRILDSPTDKTDNLLHEVVDKIINIAKHHDAEVVCGKLNTKNFNSHPQANRRVRGMSQYRLRKMLSYKLPLNGIPLRVRSEAYTTRVGEYIGGAMGLDVHKSSVYAFAIKVLDYSHFKLMCSVLADEDDGSPRRVGLSTGNGLTAHVQSLARGSDGGSLNGDDPETGIVSGEVTPRLRGRGGFTSSGVQSLGHLL